MEYLTPEVLDTILTTCASLISLFLVSFIRKKIGVEKMRKISEELMLKQELASIAVKFMQQVYGELNGKEKYDKAVDWMTSELNLRGIKINSNEAKGLIESSLKTFKDTFGQEWNKK